MLAIVNSSLMDINQWRDPMAFSHPSCLFAGFQEASGQVWAGEWSRSNTSRLELRQAYLAVYSSEASIAHGGKE